MSLLDEIAFHFGQATPSGDGYRAMCPVHDDLKPSLHLSSGQHGEVILHCHAGCQTADILGAADLDYADLFPKRMNGHHRRKTITSTKLEPKADLDQALISQVYEDFLGFLPLEDRHHLDLERRGLSKDEIVKNRYRSLSPLMAAKVTALLEGIYHEQLLDVPGFVTSHGKIGTVETYGLLIPVRNRNGRVIAIKVRQDADGSHAKYIWLSGGKGGKSIGTPAHVPLGTPAEVEIVRITEGPLKADIAWARSPDFIPTIGIAGVNQWREAAPLVKSMGAKTVYLAFDADWKRKPPVQAALHDAASGLQNLGVEVKVEVWPEEQAKGIDDLLVAGGVVTVEDVESEGVQIDFPGDDDYLVKELVYAKVKRASQIEPQPITWLWEGWIPYGAITLLDGNPGEGKSTLAADLISRVSSGRPLPGQSAEKARPASKVLVVSAEDSPAKIIIPRLIATDGNRENVFLWLGVGQKKGARLPKLPLDIPKLQALLWDHRPALVLIDPFLSYLETDTDSHKAQDVGGVLLQLAQLAEKYDTAMILVRHLNKLGGGTALYRGLGSIGIIGTARSGMILATNPDDDKQLILASTKHNWSKRPKSIVLKIEQKTTSKDTYAGRVEWVGETDLSADDLVAKPEKKGSGEATAGAYEWLQKVLADGPKSAIDVSIAADAAGVAERTIERVKKSLGVEVYREGRRWMWRLPEAEVPKKAKKTKKGAK